MLTIPGKIPITISPFFWLLAIMIGWLNSGSVLGTTIWMVVIVVSILVHEFGHALTALAFGQKVHIQLIGIGGLTQRWGSKLKLWQEFLIVLNGPCAGFLLYGLATWVKPALLEEHSIILYAITIAAYVNLFWTILNLLPVLPLDGGQLLRIVLEGMLGVKGIKIALFLSITLAISLSVFFFAIQALFAGVIFTLFAFDCYRSWKNALSMTDQDNDSQLQQLLQQAEKNLKRGHYQEAKHYLMTIREQTQGGVLYVTATQYLAHVLTNEGHLQEAFDLLLPERKNLSLDSLQLLHQLAYRIGNWTLAVELGNHLYPEAPKYEIALVNAYAYAALNQATPSVGWLQRAIKEGAPNPQDLVERREFDSIRLDPVFQRFKAQGF